MAATEPLKVVQPLARRELWLISAFPTIILIALSSRYGYHRDELYFIQCGHHLAWGYPDQPPLVPLLARVLTDISSMSLMVLRLPSALVIGATVFLTGVTAREVGASRQGQLLAATGMGLSNFAIGSGHLLSTATFDLFFWVAVIALCLRAVRTENDKLWLAVGVVGGVGVLDSDLVAFLVAALVIGVAISGPRRIFRSPWFYAGAVVLIVLPLPYLLWQAHHGWPELAIAKSIANGGSGTSQPRWLFIPFQVVMAGFLGTPLLWTGTKRLFRDPALRWCRAVPVAIVVLTILFIVTGGKPYYIDGIFAVTFGAGADPVWRWITSSGRRLKWLPIAVAMSIIGMIITLPILPAGWLHKSPVVAANYDAGETLAWPTFVAQIGDVYRLTPAAAKPTTAVLTGNYGEAGAIDRFGRSDGLPSAYSVDNAFWLWGPPPAATNRVVAVGFSRSDLRPYFARLHLVRRLNNHIGVSDDEQHAPVWVCRGPKAPWATMWPKLKSYG